MILSSSFEKNDELDIQKAMARNVLGHGLAVDVASDSVVFFPLVC